MKCSSCDYPIYEGNWCGVCIQEGRDECERCPLKICSAHRPRHSYLYPKADLTVDVICISMFREYCNTPSVLVIKRKNEPFKGHLALPGGYLDLYLNETLKEAAMREVKEETGINVAFPGLHLVGIADAPDRDPRGRTVSTVFWGEVYHDEAANIKAADDAAEVAWLPITEIDAFEFAFDHYDILRAFLDNNLSRSYGGSWILKDKFHGE